MFRSCNPNVSKNNIYDNECKKGGGGIAIGILDEPSFPCSPDINNNTISDNIASGIAGYGDGGGVFICGSTPTLSENKFERNSAFVNGGAIYIKKISNLTISGDQFINNQAGTDGGGIYISTGPVLNLNSVNFSSNSAVKGGGIYQYENSELTATYCTFSENTVSTDGGGIYAYKSISTIENCSFEDNTATGNGGGVYSNDPAYNPIILVYSKLNLNSFKSNTAYQGSALFINRATNYASNTYVLNNLFAENYATNMAVVYMQGDNSNTVFNHNTVSNNTAGTYFWIQGVCVEKAQYIPKVDATHYNFYNNIIYEPSGDVIIVYDNNNNLLLQIPSNYTTLAQINYLYRDQYYNANQVPGFVSSSDYHLTSSSSCINSGANLNSPLITTTDLDGNARIANGTTDYGCYEYGSTPQARKAKLSSNNLDINIYPNPTTDYLFISSNQELISDIEIYNASGQKIYSGKRQLIQGETTIDLTGFNAGLYFVQINTETKKEIIKFIVR